jgi:hypothetical protein
VGARGETQVAVIEGLVEVTALNDPSNSVLLDAGRSVLVQLGQALRLIGANQPPSGSRDNNDRGGPPPGNPPPGNPPPGPAPGNPPPGNQPPGPKGPQQPMAMPEKLAKNDHDPHEHDDQSPRGTASTYDRYLAGLADIGQVPFLLRFNAFSEAHLDSIENPAYAGQFRAAEGRLLFLPTFRGTRTLQEYQSAFGPGGTLPGGYSVGPQFSFFAPAGGFTFGGAASLSRVGDAGSTSNFYSGALIASRRFGANSMGLEIASLRGSGPTSDVTQTRFTAGYARSLTPTTTLGLFYRYALIDANDRDVLHTAGHSSEAGIRLRGMLAPRLSYGVTAAWLGVSLRDGIAHTDAVPSHARDRAQRGSLALGLGYALTDRTIFTFDLAGGSARTSAARNEDATRALLQNGLDRSRFASFHGAVQHDLTRHVFLSGSLLQVWQSHRLNVDLFPDRFGARTLVEDGFFSLGAVVPYASRFSDFGAGWRFTRDLYMQYVYSTDYGVTSATHTLMLRWTFRPKGR